MIGKITGNNIIASKVQTNAPIPKIKKPVPVRMNNNITATQKITTEATRIAQACAVKAIIPPAITAANVGKNKWEPMTRTSTIISVRKNAFNMCVSW